MHHFGKFLGVSTLFLTPVTAAQNAHTHGTLEMTLAIEGSEMVCEWLSPGTNLVGFEHDAVTPNEKKAVTQALSQLREAQQLFTLDSAANCSIILANASAPNHADGHNTAHKDHDHQDWQGQIQFKCQNIDKLGSIKLNWFTSFPRIAQIDLQLITEKKQGSLILTPDNYLIELN